MGLLGWLKRRSNGTDERLTAWRQAWNRAAADPDQAALASLAARLEALGLPEEDVEIEREMLDAITQLLQLRSTVASAGLPAVETGHRAIGGDRCHFSAPASMPDDEAQPSGRLLVTPSRAVFIGGPRTTTVPWHAVGEVAHSGRDLVLIRRDGQQLYRFRCNSFADALCGSFICRQLAGGRTASQQPAHRS